MVRLSNVGGTAERFAAVCHGVLIVLLAAAAASCTSSNTSVSAPSITRCGVTVINSMESAPAAGGAGTLTVSAARDCTWAASNTATWIALTSATNGQGDGSITYRVAANTTPTTRRATIDVNTVAAAIVQEAAECRFTLTPTTFSLPASGGGVTIQVQTNAACSWTATSDAGWARITAGASGEGDGSVALAVDANTGGARSAHLTVAGSVVAVEQASPAGAPPSPPAPPAPPTCSYTIQPGGQTIAAAGGPGTIDITATASTCSWTAVSNAAWITIAGGASGAGNGRVTFNAAANNGGSRTGTISVAGQTFTLSQAAASCSYSINPASEAVAATAGTTTVAVSTGGSCAWNSAANAAWITIASGASGTGPGTVKLNIAANSGAARTGTATIAAQTFTVIQAAAPCSYSLSPATVDLPPTAFEGTTNVSAGVGCTWTATSNAAWITVTGGSSGSGNGVVVFNAAANPGAARSGTISIGGQTLTVTQQPAPCTFSIAPTSQTIGALGGAGSISVTAGSSCTWSATSNNPEWLTITGGSPGSGNGQVTFSAAANATGADRTGTIIVAGQSFALTQTAQ
jgi:hypothetical protein